MIWTEEHSPALQDVITRCRATMDEHVLNSNFLVSRQGESFLLYSKGPLTQVFARMVEILVEDLPECEPPARTAIPVPTARARKVRR
ncbi:hypothetical protein DYH09_19530 [bacterium CPR1]|jgi:hypothetical protein|nr:hypothetical protein [bacterium CPR1]